MNYTVPEPYINQPAIGYVYVALLSKNAQQQITALLQSISQKLPDVIWTMPPEALHITLCEIVQSRKIYSRDKDTLFKDGRDAYVHGVSLALQNIPKFNVVIDRIEVSKDAIIVRANDGAPFNTIRARLLEHITLPEETKRPPDIIHSSIARYRQAVDIAKVEEIASRHTIYFEEEISEFKLLRTTVPPLLQYDELARFPLDQ